MIASEKSLQNLSVNIQVSFNYLKKSNSLEKLLFLVKKRENSGISAVSLNKINHSLAPCEGIFKLRHTFYEQS